MFHIDFSLKIHPAKAVDHFSLPLLGNCVRVACNGELEGCVRDITRPFIVVSPSFLMYLFVRGTRGVQLAQRPEKKKTGFVRLSGKEGFENLLDQDTSSCQDECVFF